MSGSRSRPLLGADAGAAPALAQNEQFIPNLVYRTGAYAPNGIPFANGIADYYKLVNERDGGINGVKIAWEECDTGYATDRGVECYERLKGKGPTGAAYVIPLSTGITFALTEKAPIDKIPLITMGYGRSESRDGSVFQWNFPLLGTYWTAADIILQHIAKKEGGCDKLKGKKIALVYHDSPYGKEPIALLQKRAQMHGFEPLLLPVTHPGVEQKATWLQVRQNRPDYVLLWGWGVMNSTAIKEAVAVGYPREQMYGVWWSGAEQDVRPAEDGAKGYNSVTLQHSAGPVQAARGPQEVRLRQGPGHGQMGGHRRDPLRARADRRHARRGSDPHRAGEVRQEAADRRAGALGPGEPRPHRRTHQAARLRGRAAADQGVVRRPRGRAHRPHPDLGRQELEDHFRLVRQRRQRDRSRWSRRPPPNTRPRRRSRPVAWRRTDAGPGRPRSQAAEGGGGAASVLDPLPDGGAVAAAAAPILSVNNIEVVYDHVILVLKGVSLEVPKGEIVALLGANGAGKSTTLKAISNLLSAERGEVTKGSIVLRRRRGPCAHAQRTGAARLHPGDGRAPLLRSPFGRGEPSHRRLYPPRRQGGDPARSRSRLLLLSAPAGAPRLDRRIHFRRRAADVRDRAGADVAAEDDPARRALDGACAAAGRGDLRDRRRSQRSEGVSFLLAEQNTNMALKYARYGYVLENGRVVLDGEARALRENEDVKEFYLGIAEGRRKSFREGKHYRRRKRWLA